jgi:23S rRNA (adenine2030-N6)-methyltransferase
MNYRHHFHAGNFADVMKHVLLMGLLAGMRRKDGGFCYIDTHAGLGLYDLSQSPAQKTGEFKDGIGRLADAKGAPAWVADYLTLVQTLQSERHRGFYPGSPWLAMRTLRQQDRSALIELHPEDAADLRSNAAGWPRTAVHERDAYEGLMALIPPKEKRGLVLIDPPYETERQDYAQVVELLTKAYAKWPGGVYALWYPIKERGMINRFFRRLKDSRIPKILACELCVMPDDNSLGLNGTGMIIVNPPWPFADQAQESLEWLKTRLSDHAQAKIQVSWLSGDAQPQKKNTEEDD